MFNFIIGLFALIGTIDLIFLFIQIAGESAAGIVSWLCYPFFGLLPLPLIWGIVLRLLEGGALFFFLGHLFG